MSEPFYLYNSLTRKKDLFEPIKPGFVSLYTCGPTVYNTPHIGNVKKYIDDDVLKRALSFNGFEVKHVQNVTDVGHLVSDSDEGEDKLEKGAREKGEDIWQLARRLEDYFYLTLDKVNILRPDVIQRATDPEAIKKQIEMIQILVDKGYGYVCDSAVYFDVSKLSEYNPFSNQPLEDKVKGTREDLVTDSQKRNSSDFALWVFRKGIHENHIMHWDSPWGDGFPGWHIECSAISIGNLGEYIDIHTGGIDHIEIHHPNEIAQNFGVTGHQVVNFWVHHEFLLVDGEKMSKSKNNFYVLEDLVEKGFDPLAFRYFVLGTHNRKVINFTFEALESAQNALNRLRKGRPQVGEDAFNEDEKGQVKDSKYYKSFLEAINDDVNTPKALAVLWEVFEDSKLDSKQKALLLSEFDEVLGLDIYAEGDYETDLEKIIPLEDLHQDIKDLIDQRESLRQQKKYQEADDVRLQIEEQGYLLKDTPEGLVISTR